MAAHQQMYAFSHHNLSGFAAALQLVPKGGHQYKKMHHNCKPDHVCAPHQRVPVQTLQAVKQSVEGQQAATKEEVTKSRGRKKGRIRELEEIRSELAEKELVLLGKEKQLLDKDQTVQVLREEVCTDFTKVSEVLCHVMGRCIAALSCKA
jgi:predicted hydrocarbon binding protein